MPRVWRLALSYFFFKYYFPKKETEGIDENREQKTIIILLKASSCLIKLSREYSLFSLSIFNPSASFCLIQ